MILVKKDSTFTKEVGFIQNSSMYHKLTKFVKWLTLYAHTSLIKYNFSENFDYFAYSYYIIKKYYKICLDPQRNHFKS